MRAGVPFKGFLRGDFLGDFLGVVGPLALPGEALRPPLCGGIAFGGENMVVVFSMDLTWGGNEGYWW